MSEGFHSLQEFLHHTKGVLYLLSVAYLIAMSEGFHSLQEFLHHTKGVLYLLSVAYLIGFVFFWRYLHDREREDD